jgi:hypothetical protein
LEPRHVGKTRWARLERSPLKWQSSFQNDRNLPRPSCSSGLLQWAAPVGCSCRCASAVSFPLAPFLFLSTGSEQCGPWLSDITCGHLHCHLLQASGAQQQQQQDAQQEGMYKTTRTRTMIKYQASRVVRTTSCSQSRCCQRSRYPSQVAYTINPAVMGMAYAVQSAGLTCLSNCHLAAGLQ